MSKEGRSAHLVTRSVGKVRVSIPDEWKGMENRELIQIID